MAAKSILGGDDVRALVVDCGTCNIRFGSSGDDTPRSIMPAIIGHRFQVNPDAMTDEENKPAQKKSEAGDKVLISPNHFQDIAPIHTFKPDGIVINWDAMQLSWQAACANLKLKFSDSPFFIVEPTRGWSQDDRAKAIEHAFEGCSVPAAYVGRGSAMSAFASARTTACVLDIGYHGACAVPVIDGYPLLKKIQRSAAGGKFLSERLQEWAEKVLDERSNYDGTERKLQNKANATSEQKQWLRAHHELRKVRIMSDEVVRQYKVEDLSGLPPLSKCTAAHKNFFRLRVMDEMKAATFRVVQNDNTDSDGKDGGGKESQKSNGLDNKNDEGKENDSSKDAKESKDKGKDKSRPPRDSEYVLPDGIRLSLDEDNGTEIPSSLFTNDEANGLTSMTDLVFNAVSNSDVDLRRDLFNGVIITGGTSLISGVVERVTRELAINIPQAYKLKLNASPNSVERTCAAWIGGSIVSSLGTFQQAWISKAEYDELGSTNALRKCP